MKLVKCHIENFGCLSGLDIDFHSQIQEFHYENGWGKTTLAAFIKAMFFGLAGSKKRRIEENERTRYAPWNGGYFGGELEFETGGRRYRIERDFGKKEKDSLFRLYDAVTGMESTDFTENIGQELFELDAESFGRTAFMDHRSLHYEGINSMIGAKVGDLSSGDDLEQYDRAMKLLEDYLNANSPTRKTGRIAKLSEEISQMRQRISVEPANEKRREELQRLCRQQTEVCESLKEQLERLNQESGERNRRHQLRLDAGRYRELTQALKERRNHLEAEKETLGGVIPQREEIRQAEAAVEELVQKRRRLEEVGRSFEEEEYARLSVMFEEHPFTEEDADAQIEAVNEVQRLLHRNEALADLAQKEQEREHSERLEQEKQIKAKQQEEQKSRSLCRTWGIVALAGGVSLCAAGYLLQLLLPVIAAGLVMLASGIFLLLLSFRKPGNEAAHPAAAAGNERDRRGELTAEMEANLSRICSLEEGLRAVMAEYGLTYSSIRAESLLYDLKNQADTFRQMQQQKKQQTAMTEVLKQELHEGEQRLEKTLSRIGITEPYEDDNALKQSLRERTDALIRYESQKQELEKAQGQLEQFCKEHQEALEQLQKLAEEPEADGAADPSKALEEANRLDDTQRRQLQEQLAEGMEMLSRYNRQLEEVYEQKDELEGLKDELYEQENRKQELKEAYLLHKKTREYLKQAKEQLIARFLQPLKSAFEEYYSSMRIILPEEYRMDADVNLMRKEEGTYHSIASQSDGYGDMIGLCMRLALLDVMYTQERPMLIMDDPFSNLDEDKIEGGKRFLRQIAEKYQVLYFTCHESRTLEV